MRIKGWTIEAFGALTDVALRDLGAGLVIFAGPNGSGKSTTLAFLQWLLFGYPSGRRGLRHETLDGSPPAGRLLLEDDQGPLVVVRRAEQSRGLEVSRPGGAKVPATAWASMLGSMDRETFAAVNVFDLRDLRALEALADTKLRERILGEALSGGGATPGAALTVLDREAQALYRPRGASRVRELEIELERLAREMARLERESAEAGHLAEGLERLTAEVSQLEEEWLDLSRALVELEQPLPLPTTPLSWTEVLTPVVPLVVAAAVPWTLERLTEPQRTWVFLAGLACSLSLGVSVMVRRAKRQGESRVRHRTGVTERNRSRETLLLRRREVELERGAVARERARLELAYARWSKDQTPARLAQERAARQAEHEEALSRWRRLVLARAMVEEAGRRWTREREAAILDLAGRWLGAATEGGFRRIRLDGQTLRVEDASARDWSPERLSRGTAELLFLCLRLAYVQIATGSVRLPVILDDVFVNLDGRRADAAARLVAEMARERQVLYFTCHQHTLACLLRHAPAADLREMPHRSGVRA